MLRFLQANHRTEQPSESPARLNVWVSRSRSALLWIFVLGVIGFLGIHAFRLNDRFLLAEQQEDRIIELAGIISRLDEVLTMSANMAAASGDPRWEARYRQFEPELDAAIREAMTLSAGETPGSATAHVNAANIALVSMENRAFDEVRRENRDTARTLLQGPEYEKQKKVYRDGLESLLSSVREHNEQVSVAADRGAEKVMALLVLVVFLAAVSLLLHRHLRQLRGEKARSQQQILVQYDFLNKILESLPHPFFVIDAEDYSLKLSNSAGRADSRGEETTCYGTSHRRNEPCDESDHPCPVRMIRETGEPVVVEHTHTTPDRGRREMEVHGYPVFDGQGRVSQVIEYSLDITERRKAERKLKESESHLQAIQDNIETGILVVDAETHRIVDVNPAARRLIGAAQEEILGRVCHHYVCRADEGKCPITDLGQTVRNRESVLLTADGREIPVLKTVIPVTLGGRKCLLDTFVDITERKKMIETLTESEQKFRTIAASAQDAILMIDYKGRISYWNEAAEGIFGRSSEEVIGKELHPLLAPERYRDGWEKGHEQFRRTGRGAAVGKTLELTALRKDGTEFPIELSLAGVNVKGEWHAIGIIRDITDRKRAEQELHRAKEEAEQSSRNLNLYALEVEQKNVELEFAGHQAEAANRAKSQFLANMSHEIRTPMNAVIGMTGLLLETDLTPEQREYAETVRTSGEGLLDLINDILDFSKSEAGKLEFEEIPFDLRTCLEELGDLLAQKAHDKGLELAILVRYDVPTRVKGDPGRLRQVLLNLANNAIKFTEKGEVLVRASLVGLEEEKETVKFEVIDTGIGIPADRVDRLFKPFSQGDASMTRRYGGTGLGLAISSQILEAMGGKIRVESVPGQGTTFYFTTVFSRQAEDGSLPEPVRPEEIRGLRVLIVDHNATNRLIFREQFKAWGCRTDEAVDGPEALNMLRAAARVEIPFQLALIDFQMPGMDGEQLAREIRSEPGTAGIPLILVTSVPRRGDAVKMVQAGFDAYLVKPVKLGKLFEALATVLGIRQKNREETPRNLVTQHSLNETARGHIRVLVVEDNIVNQRVTTRVLERYGCRCDVAANGREAVDALKRIPYRIVFMDCQMPVMDGFEATREIRKRENSGRRTPIIAMTAHAMRGDREQCLEAGMDDYLSKPVTAPELRKVLERYLDAAPHRPAEAAPAETAREEPVRIRTLRGIADGDPVFERELISEFLRESEQLLQALRISLREGDARALRRGAHTLKGASATIGARAMREAADRLERLGPGVEPGPAASEALARLQDEFVRARDFLQAHLGRGEPLAVAPEKQMSVPA